MCNGWLSSLVHARSSDTFLPVMQIVFGDQSPTRLLLDSALDTKDGASQIDGRVNGCLGELKFLISRKRKENDW